MSWWEQLDGPVLGRYRIERLLGEGGMARVFLATDAKAGRAVAFKTPKLESFPPDRVQELLARFNREFRSQASDPIQGVIPIYESGEFTDDAGVTRPFLAMQFLSGGSLAEKLGGQIGRREHRQTLGEVLDWLVPIARTLDRLHARKYLHRDVKPDNILFNTDGDPFLADFGIVGTLDDALNGSTLGIVATGLMGSPGSPGYQSPESIQADPGLRNVSSSDQFSLAVTVYEALSGVLPARAGTSQEWYGALMHWAPIPLSDPAPEMPPAAVVAVMKAMSLQPRERFTSCSEFAKALSAATTSSSAPAPTKVAAKPKPAPTAPARGDAQAPPTAGAGQGKRTWIRALGFLLLIVAVLGGLLWWQQAQEQAERDRRADAILAAVPADASLLQRTLAWKESINVRNGDTPATASTASGATNGAEPASETSPQDPSASGEVISVIYFEAGEPKLPAEIDDLLAPVIDRLNRDPNLRVRVEGHTRSHELTIGGERANLVWNYLSKQGFRFDRIGIPVSKAPVAEDSSEGQLENRRVRIIVVRPTPAALATVHFDFDKSSLRPQSSMILDAFAQEMKDKPGLNIEIDGHASSEDANGAGQRRAQAVRDYLASQGVDAGRMETADFGTSRAAASNDTEAGRAKNRRVEIVAKD